MITRGDRVPSSNVRDAKGSKLRIKFDLPKPAKALGLKLSPPLSTTRERSAQPTAERSQSRDWR